MEELKKKLGIVDNTKRNKSTDTTEAKYIEQLLKEGREKSKYKLYQENEPN